MNDVVERNHVRMLGLKQRGSLVQIRPRIAENCQWNASFCSQFLKLLFHHQAIGTFDRQYRQNHQILMLHRPLQRDKMRQPDAQNSKDFDCAD